MKLRRTSFAFLMEMLWVCGFFILSACIFVLAFMKADRLSLNAQNLNQAVAVVQNTLEDTFYSYETGADTTGSRILYYDKNWLPVSDEQQAAFSVSVNAAVESGLLQVSADASNADGTNIYSLDGSRYLSD